MDVGVSRDNLDSEIIQIKRSMSVPSRTLIVSTVVMIPSTTHE